MGAKRFLFSGVSAGCVRMHDFKAANYLGTILAHDQTRTRVLRRYNRRPLVFVVLRERIDLVGRNAHASSPTWPKSRALCDGRNGTVLEVAYAVASARLARSMKANIGRLEHQSATSGH
eukprot:IDg19594t1